MPDQASFPQIPTSVWWGVRGILNRNPRTKFDDTTLAVQLDVQPAAARQYLSELKRLGLLTEDGNATDVALRWRVDETYRDATNELLARAYPQQLLDLAPAEEADRSKVENWFVHQGLGQGTARNKAATYMLLANGEPSANPPQRATGQQGQRAGNKAPGPERGRSKPAADKTDRDERPKDQMPDQLPLNVNVQIHISADASSEQIETIFSSMRKYIYGDVAA